MENPFNLDSAVQGNKVMQDFELESLSMGVDHSQKVKATPIESDYSLKDCVNLLPSTAESRLHVLNQKEKPWYSQGLRFKCTGCGECCTGAPGYVWVNTDEISAMAAGLNISIDEFSKKYLRQVGAKYSLREDSKTFDCIFLKDKKCTIYKTRPVQCQTFPWWIQNLRSEQDWQNASQYCEGINHRDAQVVPLDMISSEVDRSPI